MAIKLGELLVRTRVISQEQLDAALDRQAAYGGRLGEVLVHYGFVNEEVLVRALSKITGIPRADLSAGPDPAALSRVSRELAEHCQLVPVALADDGRLVVAANDPQSEADLARVREEAGCEVVLQFATATDIRAARDRWYSTHVVTAPIALGAAGPAAASEPHEQPEPRGAHASSEPLAQPEQPPPERAAQPQRPPHEPPHTPSALHAPRAQVTEEESGEEAAPIGLLSLRSGQAAVFALAVLSLLLAAAVVYAVLLRARLDEAGRGLEAHLKTIALQAQQVEALDLLATRVDQFNHDFGGALGRLQVADLELGVERLQKKPDLPAQAKQLLAEFEKNAAEIRAMTAQLKEYQAYLGAPTQVKRGDSHSQLALDYLTKQAGLAQPQAEAVLRQTALAWDLEPGNQVYSLYRDGLLLTTVTQGTAARPPLLAQSAQRRALQAKAQGLEAQLRECEAKEKAPQ